mmetsp:Transcript_43065/g.77373  ORF Transcript_43065/g.77373 Transcript_43065/m.77373 type:complete len:88 (+) Transcript_43065:918-1181(+)
MGLMSSQAVAAMKKACPVQEQVSAAKCSSNRSVPSCAVEGVQFGGYSAKQSMHRTYVAVQAHASDLRAVMRVTKGLNPKWNLEFGGR